MRKKNSISMEFRIFSYDSYIHIGIVMLSIELTHQIFLMALKFATCENSIREKQLTEPSISPILEI